MIKFTCRYCDRSSKIDRFRSKYANVCLECYKKDCDRRMRLPYAKYSRLKYNARKLGVLLEITKEEFSQYQNMDCHYCGLPVSGRTHLTSRTNTGSGLDRKDPAKGYTKDNVVPACFLCNRTKNCWFSYEEMLVLGKTIRKILRARTQIK